MKSFPGQDNGHEDAHPPHPLPEGSSPRQDGSLFQMLLDNDHGGQFSGVLDGQQDNEGAGGQDRNGGQFSGVESTFDENMPDGKNRRLHLYFSKNKSMKFFKCN